MLSGPEETRLVRAAAAGDGPAFARLYEAYERRIFNYLLRLLGDRHGAEDATQEAFINVMAKLPDLDQENLQFGAYLYTAARNAGYDMIAGRKKMEPTGAVPEQAESPHLGEMSDLETDPERSALASSQEAAVQAANGRLPERQREVLALREVDGLSYDEIAGVMEMKSNAVAQLISRARIGLRKEMRVGAASSVAYATPDCEKAHGALACRQDGQPDDLEEWLDGHLALCSNCQVASEEMAEAGVSYRAWAPVLPAAWVFREVMAKANEVVGHDWSEVERPEGEGTASTRNTFGSRSRRAAAVAAGSVLVAAIFATFLLVEADAPERLKQVREAVVKPLAAKKTVRKEGPRKAKVNDRPEATAGTSETVKTPVGASPDSPVTGGSDGAPSPGGSSGNGSPGSGGRPAITAPGSLNEPAPAPPAPTDPAPTPTPPPEPPPPTDPGPPSTPIPGGPPNLAIPGGPTPG